MMTALSTKIHMMIILQIRTLQNPRSVLLRMNTQCVVDKVSM